MIHSNADIKEFPAVGQAQNFKLQIGAHSGYLIPLTLAASPRTCPSTRPCLDPPKWDECCAVVTDSGLQTRGSTCRARPT